MRVLSADRADISRKIRKYCCNCQRNPENCKSPKCFTFNVSNYSHCKEKQMDKTLLTPNTFFFHTITFRFIQSSNVSWLSAVIMLITSSINK